MRLLVLLAAALGLAADTGWPRFRGPNGTGVADGNPPADFGPAGNLAWKATPPAGKASPVIVNGKLILTGHNGDSFITVA